MNPTDRNMYEVAFRTMADTARRIHGEVWAPANTLTDAELLLWAEAKGLTHADIVRINF